MSCGQAVAQSRVLNRREPGHHPTIATAEAGTHSEELKDNRRGVYIPGFAFVRSIGHLAGGCELVHCTTKVFLEHRSLLEKYRGLLHSS